MSRMEMVRLALSELGDAPSQELSSFIQQKYGEKIEPNYIPVFKASLRDLEKLNRFRQTARTVQPA